MCFLDEKKKIKVRLMRENYIFLRQFYDKYFFCNIDVFNKYFDVSLKEINTFDKFFNIFLKGIFKVCKNNYYIFVVCEDEYVVEKHINVFKTDFFQFYLNEFKSKYRGIKRCDIVEKNLRLNGDEIVEDYIEFGMMGEYEYEDFFVVNKTINYTRLINFFVFLLKESYKVVDFDEIEEIIIDRECVDASVIHSIFYQIFEKILFNR